MLRNQLRSKFFDREIKLNANHQALSADFFYNRQLCKFVLEKVTESFRIVDKLFVTNDIQYCGSRRAGQMVAAEGGAQLAVKGSNIRMDDSACHREAVAHTFGYGHDISPDSGVLMGKKAARTAVARLDFIQNKQRFRL